MEIDIVKETARINRRRYYLHRKARESEFKLDSHKRTFYHEQGKDVPSNKYLQELIDEFGYALQYELKS